ncbi:alcohol dehydrogenase [Pholiota conissans]|uniref:pyranose dehydrogenase (acceptor) n=1 Tax=Pholiota conissans TaxID=109636 RepID=A0A9P5YUI5_9AGAR|nr:alcohol dehydrogenase [Pholiota conissans]
MRLTLKSLSLFHLVLSTLSIPAHGAYLKRDLPDYTADNTAAASSQYDYIVVGSGPGGGPLAARLAQSGFSVLLIDAGKDHGDDPIVQVPVFQGAASEYAPISWQFFVNHYADQTVAKRDSKFTYKMPDGRFWVGPNPPAGSEPLGIWYPRTGTLGGCAEHNAQILIYPAESDWNNIATLTGDSSWSASNMRKYWTKLENNQYLIPSPANSVGHGFNGWLDSSVSDPGPLFKDPTLVGMLQSAITTFGKAASKALNYKTLVNSPTATNLAQFASLDLNTPSASRDTASGVYQVPLSINNATKSRASQRDLILNTASTFNLKLQLNTLVTKIIFDNSTVPRAIGVQYQTGRHLYRADPNAASGVVTGTGSFFAKREVIVAGGVFNTPQLLKLSGIGPKAELAAHNIPLVHESPAVGTNMQDRYEVGVIAETPTDFTVWNGCTFGNTTDDACLIKWATDANDHGIYGGNTFAFGLTLASSVSDPTTNDLFTGGIPAIFKGYYPGWSNRTLNAHSWTWLTLKAHARNNAGTVTLTSSDPRDVPAINFNYWTNGGDQDLQATYEGVQFTRKMLAAASNVVGPMTETWPGPAVQTEAQVKQWIKDEAWGHHASCTAPIGPANDTTASVLDSKFRVKGVQGLRVVDASAFPKIPSFYIVSAVYMISEKAADVIIQDAQGR